MKNKATAISPANIAFIKYWGKKDPVLNIPFNDSISMNMDHCLTTTTVEFSDKFKKDMVVMNGKKTEGVKFEKVISFLDIVRKKAGIKQKARVETVNNFPGGAGIAASASAFSALALAASKAAGLKLGLKELSVIARLGSGSAARSVVDGFAYWNAGKKNEDSYAVKLKPESFWDLRDIVAVVDSGEKKVSSTEGHGQATSSSFYGQRLIELDRRIPAMKKALLKKDFLTFGKLLEEEAVELHMIAMTSKPPIFYWNKGTFEVIEKLFDLRQKGVYAFFTMDAGANVHVICRAKDEAVVNRNLKKLPNVLFTIINKTAKGTLLSEKHLF